MVEGPLRINNFEEYPLELLEDPLDDRRVPSVSKPPKWALTEANLYEMKNGKQGD